MCLVLGIIRDEMEWGGSISLVFGFGANRDGSISGGSLIGLSLSVEIKGMASSHIYGVVDLARVGSFSIIFVSVELVSRGDVAPPIINQARDAMAPPLLGGLSLPSLAHTSAEAQGWVARR